MARVLFRVDGGPRSGLGHLQRSCALATALVEGGATCALLTEPDATVRARIVAEGFPAFSIGGVPPGSPGDLEQTLALGRGGEGVVVDSYAIDERYLERLRSAGLAVVAIDDLARYPFPCQLVINAGADPDRSRYRSSSGDTRFLLGPRYALLRREFWAARPRVTRQPATTVLVTLGGADRHGLMPRLLRGLDALIPAVNVTAILGPFFADRTTLEEAVQSAARPVRLIEAPTSLAPLMWESDLAVSAAGQTSLELAATGTPTIAIRTADNQADNLRVLEEAGAVRLAGAADDAYVVERVVDLARELVEDQAARAALSARAQRLVDGRGAERVASEVLAITGAGGTVAAIGRREAAC